jgi:hypothetical protein
VKTAVRFSIQEARREDERFLSEMLYEATTWRPEPHRFSVSEVLSLPEIAVYISVWGRPGDEGLIAEAETGEVGAVLVSPLLGSGARLRLRERGR